MKAKVGKTVGSREMIPGERSGKGEPHAAVPILDWIRPSGGRILVAIKVIPGAARSEMAGLRDGCLLVRVAAAPEKGKANAALISCLAEFLDLAKAEIVLVSGSLSRRKLLSLPASCEERLKKAVCIRD
jgi:uncharacterized protein (TIGR00251 family)